MSDGVKKPMKLKRETEAIKDRINRDVKTIFEQQLYDYYSLLAVGNFCSNSYKSNVDRNKTLSLKEYLDEIKLYLKA